jgi:FkbM family methyltransferase
MLRALRRVARGLGVERQALAVRRRLLPAHVRADIRDHELLLALLERSLAPDSDCLDVGAHVGAVLREMVRLAPRGRHVAWEPLPEFAHRLRTEFPTVEVREAALSDRACERAFAYVLSDPGWSGFLERPTPGGGPVETITVRSERLDDALADAVRPAFLKIDVEGAEELVLRGALETLRRHRPLIAFEHGLGSADYYGTTPERIHDLLAGELGYGIRGMDGDGPYARAEFGAIFARGERVNFVAHPTADVRSANGAPT